MLKFFLNFFFEIFFLKIFFGKIFLEIFFFNFFFNFFLNFFYNFFFGKGEVSTIRLGLHEASGFRKYSTLLVIQLFSRRLCVCHCLCIRLCLCICFPNSFLNSYHHKLSENVWVWGCGATRSEIWTSVTIAGRTNNQPNNQQGKIELLSQWTMEG